MLRDHSPVTIDRFRGLWRRGNIEETPMDHFSECNNIQYYGDNSFETRDGLGRHQDVGAPLSDILRIYNYPTDQFGNTLLVLTTGGTIYHVIDATTQFGPILTIPGMTDFAFVPYAGRAYISPFTTEVSGALNRERGLQNEFLYVYKGDGTAARKAGATSPTGTLTIANGAAGNTDGGTHVFGVVFETDTGYLSPPGALNSFVTSDLLSLDFSNIPVSPDAHVIARHLVASKVIQNYNGDVNGYQLFFIPGGNIPNNVSTTLNSISFFDGDLLDDASHLSDNFDEIPAGCALFTYHNRLCFVGEYSNPTTVVRVSSVGEPEAFDQVDGLLEVPSDGNYLTNGAELRDVLYIMRRSKTVSYVDNDDLPATWPLTIIDNAMGCGVHGISTVLDSGSANVDYLLISSYTGLVLFNGRYILPELTWKVQNFWAQQNFKNRNRVIQVLNDSVLQRIYVVLTDNTLLYGDYSDGFDPKNIKWGPWTFDVKVNSIALINISELLLGCDQAP